MHCLDGGTLRNLAYRVINPTVTNIDHVYITCVRVRWHLQTMLKIKVPQGDRQRKASSMKELSTNARGGQERASAVAKLLMSTTRKSRLSVGQLATNSIASAQTARRRGFGLSLNPKN